MGDGEGNALLKAVFQGKLRLTRLLLEGGAYINEGNERGETPVSAACIAAGYDSPLARQRMVRYLLEKGADPNIPDKQGRTALMHACAERAGKEVVSLLLENGADPSLKDYSGSSALVHAINRGDRDTLQVLLDACKARGKEVIIITTDTSPSGTKKTKQYLNAPPSPGLVDTKQYLNAPPSPGLVDTKTSPSESCMSPSEVLIGTSGSPTEGSAKGEAGEAGVFSFTLTSALPLPAPAPRPAGGEKRPPPRKLLKRLNSEPWGLVAPSLLSGGPHGGLEEEEGTPGLSRVVKEMNGLSVTDPPAAATRPLLSRRHSIETHDPCSPKLMDRSCSEDPAQLCNSFWADRSLYRRNTAPEAQEGTATARSQLAQEGTATARAQLAQEGTATARAQLAHPKLTRMDHYESDAHLCPSHSIPGSPDSGRCVSVERRKYNTSPLSLLLGSSSSRGSPRGSLEDVPSSVSPVTVRRRTPGILERRGSGTLLLDHISHSRPGFLPPLNLNSHRPLIPVIRANGVKTATSPVHSSSSSGGQRVLVPVAPASPNKRLCPDFKTKKKLLRRHSMQTEQMKQLSSFQELLAHKVCQDSGD